MNKILYVASESNPFSPKQGSEQRSCLLLKACLQIGEVDVISFCSDVVDDSYGANILFSKDIPDFAYQIYGTKEKVKRLVKSFIPSLIVPINPEKKRIVDYYIGLKKYDYIVIRYAFSAIHCGLLQYRDRLVVDIDDSPAEKIKIHCKAETGHQITKFYWLYCNNINRSMKWFEKKVHRTFYSNITDNQSKYSLFLPNIPFYDYSCKTELEPIPGRLLFVGDLEYYPNYEGVEYFVEKILPIIRCHFGGVSFHVVGKCSEKIRKKLNSYPSVNAMGFIPSLEKEYEEACVFVIPIKNGSGTCIKFLEAVKMGRAIVTTNCGFRGYNRFFSAGKDCFVTDSCDEFARDVLALLNDRTFRSVMVESALNKYSSYYSKAYFDNIVAKALLKI